MEVREQSNQKKRWTQDEEISFWEELKVAWDQCHQQKSQTLELKAETTDYFMVICYSAFHRKWVKCATRFPAPAVKELWRELLGFLPKKDKVFLDYVIYGGMAYAVKKGLSPEEEVALCLKEIKGRFFLVIQTTFFFKWMKMEEKREKEIPPEDELGGPILPNKGNGLRPEELELVKLGGEEAKVIFLQEMINDCSRWAKRELIPGRAERVVYLFGYRNLLSSKSSKLLSDLGAKRLGTLYDNWGLQLKGIKAHVSRLDGGMLDEPAQLIVAAAVLTSLEEFCLDWFYSEKKNEGLFSCLPNSENEN